MCQNDKDSMIVVPSFASRFLFAMCTYFFFVKSLSCGHKHIPNTFHFQQQLKWFITPCHLYFKNI